MGNCNFRLFEANLPKPVHAERHTSVRASAPLRLEYLDGLRGAASFYVVLFHAGVGFSSLDLPAWARNLRRVLSFGHDAVAVFIVLSGYCLMLPVARGDGFLIGGMRRYLGRRAWRILPPYYVTLLASLLLLWAIPILQSTSGTTWDDSSPAFGWGPIGTHLLLIHNLFPAWVSRINGPLWSVATEWQIYFFFPLVLLPVWRKLGSLSTVAVGFALGCAPIWSCPRVAEKWIPWYLGLFALGMCAAGIGFSERALERRLLARVPWKLVLGVLALACLLGTTLFVKAWFRNIPLSDSLVGLTTATLLVCYSAREIGDAARSRPLLLRTLESRPLLALGRFSYSLYLTHLPVVALVYFALRGLPLSAGAQLMALLVLGTLASLFVAYGFFLGCERHFVGRPRFFGAR